MLITLAHDEILTNEFLRLKSGTWYTGDADCGIALVNRATRARAIGTYSRCHFLVDHL
jgi:hypothetical protein